MRWPRRRKPDPPPLTEAQREALEALAIIARQGLSWKDFWPLMDRELRR